MNEASSGNRKSPLIPFNFVEPLGTEFEYIRQAYAAMHICGDGVFTQKCHELLERTLGVHKALLTTSCTHALEMAAILLAVKPGDEVIVPSFTFPSAINAFVLRGARPVFIDIRPDTLNLDESRLEGLITPATKAIVLLHYAGVGCQMDEISRIAGEHGIALVEDNAHGLFGAYRGRPLGTFGALSTLSFHETKNFSCGEGGALLINRPELVERAEIVREKGTDRKRFFRGEVDKYSWVDIGSSYLPSDILAAILHAQFEGRDAIQAKRRAVWNRYCQGLSAWAAAQNSPVRLPFIPPECGHTHHIFYLLLPDLSARQALAAHLKDRGVLSLFHYVPLHLSQMGRGFGGRPGQCPVAESVSDRLLRLPLYPSLSEEDQNRVIAAIREFECPPPSSPRRAPDAARP